MSDSDGAGSGSSEQKRKIKLKLDERWFNQYEIQKTTCTHKMCDDLLCIINPIPVRAIMEWKYVSCLRIPMWGGFKRIVTEKKGKQKPEVTYEKKLSRKGDEPPVVLRNLDQVFQFILKHDLSLTIDLFCFDGRIDCEAIYDKTLYWKKLILEDLSCGQELLQIPVVNLVDDEVPGFDEYITKSVFKDDCRYKRTRICCDCTDNCKDKMKCACFLETLSHYTADEKKNYKDCDLGYNFKKLQFRKQNLSGIYECNPKCSCSDLCLNRVAQYPSKWKLQLFKEPKTQEKGWGVRALNDIPEGSFVGTYTGEMSEEYEANVNAENLEWRAAGMWKYIVNLQVLQNVEKVGHEELRARAEAEQKKKPLAVLPSSFWKTVKKLPFPNLKFGHLNVPAVYDLPSQHLNIQDSHQHPSRAALESGTDNFVAGCVDTWDTFRSILTSQWNAKKEALMPKKAVEVVKIESVEEQRNSTPVEEPIPMKVSSLKLRYTVGEEEKIYHFSSYLRPNSVASKILASERKRRAQVKKLAMKKKKEAPGKTLRVKNVDEENVPSDFLPSVILSDVMKDVRRYNKKHGKFFEDSLGAVVIKGEPSANDECVDEQNDENKEPQVETDLPARRGRSAPQAGESRKRISASPRKRRLSVSEESERPSKVPRLSSRKPKNPLSSSNEQPSCSTRSSTPKKAQICSDVSRDETSPGPEKSKETVPVNGVGVRAKGKYALRQVAKKNYTDNRYDELLKTPRKGARQEEPKQKVAKHKHLYLIDGRKKGNIGRYFNHACDPNLFCQYVFTDTHDVRFPVVAFFAKRTIKAGEELTWCYNYDDDVDIGVEPIPCLCGAPPHICRGALI